jgi:YgiT-type zinc finger domain-containing protein
MMTDERYPEAALETCPECQVGMLKPGMVPYYATLEGTLVHVPSFPAWVCDICRHCEYDEDALDALRLILGPAAQIPAQSNPRRRLPPENLAPWSRTDSRKGSK